MTTLREEIKKHRGKLLKIGMASSFVYVHVCDENTESDIQTINKAYRDNMKMAYEQNKLLIDEYPKRFMNRVMRAKQAKRDGWIKNTYGKPQKLSQDSIKKYKKLLAMSPEEIEEHLDEMRDKHIARSRKYSWHLKHDLPMLDRQVLEVYTSFEDKNTIIVIVEGIEEGAYWFPSEYNKAIKQGKIIMKIFDDEESENGEE